LAVWLNEPAGAGKSAPAGIARFTNTKWKNPRGSDDNLDALPSTQLIAIDVSRWL
jgi:hypothetical protein